MSLRVCFKKILEPHSIEVDLCLAKHGVTALYGPSGAGKTTILRVIAGLERADNADISLNGEVWEHDSQFVPTHKRQLGIVFQQPSLFEHMNVEQNIFYAQRVAKQAQQPSFSIQPFIQQLQLTPLLKRHPNTLSGGEQQRVAIVRALAANPKILLMDEPLASLDDETKFEFMAMFESLLRQISLPVLYITHSKQEVARLSEHLVLIDKGKCVAQGKTRDLFCDLSLNFAQQDDAKCALRAKVVVDNKPQHVSQLSTQAGLLWTANVSQPIDTYVNLVIQAKDVSVTLSRQIDTSILNVLEGCIADFRTTSGGNMILKIAVGEAFILSQITIKSFTELHLKKQQKVFAQIKSVAVY
jgi:molybdate transport system ATP-binding protein